MNPIFGNALVNTYTRFTNETYDNLSPIVQSAMQSVAQTYTYLMDTRYNTPIQDEVVISNPIPKELQSITPAAITFKHEAGQETCAIVVTLNKDNLHEMTFNLANLKEKSATIKNNNQNELLLSSTDTMTNMQVVHALNFLQADQWPDDLTFKDLLAIWHFGQSLNAPSLIQKVETTLVQAKYTLEALEHFRYVVDIPEEKPLADQWTKKIWEPSDGPYGTYFINNCLTSVITELP